MSVMLAFQPGAAMSYFQPVLDVRVTVEDRPVEPVQTQFFDLFVGELGIVGVVTMPPSPVVMHLVA